MAVEHEKFKLAQENAKLAAEMVLLKSRYSSAHRRVSRSPATSSCVSSPSPAPIIRRTIKQERDDCSFTLLTPQNSNRFQPSTISPPLSSSPTSSSLTSSSSSTPIISSYSRSPSPSINLGLGLFDNGSSDMAQHPAAMLCGLQCQSEGPASWPASILHWTSPNAFHQSPSFRLHPHKNWVLIHLFCLTLSSIIYSQLLHPLHQIFLSLRTGSPLPRRVTPTKAPMLFLLINWLILTPANLTPAPATIYSPSMTKSTQRPTRFQTTTTTTTTVPMGPSPPPTTRPATFRLSLLRRLLLCSPDLARPLRQMGATARAMRLETSKHALSGPLNGRVSTEGSTLETAAVERNDDDAAASRRGNISALASGEDTMMGRLISAIDLIERERRAARHRRRRQRGATKATATRGRGRGRGRGACNISFHKKKRKMDWELRKGHEHPKKRSLDWV